MKLSLGTVQLGVAYGVNNAVGALSDEQAAAVLDAAVDSGFSMVDTSIDYGLAIERIGRFLERRPGAIDVVAKYHATLPAETIRKLQAHCEKLIGGVTHSLLWTSGGHIDKLDPSLADGVTVYTVEEAEAIPAGFNMVQVPASILDGRMDAEIKKLQDDGRTVLVRSLLLQGLLASDPKTGPVGHHRNPALPGASLPYIVELRRLADDFGMGVVELAVRWVWEIMPDVAILGAETPEQARELGAAWNRGPLPREAVARALEIRDGVPEVVISPRMWNQDFNFKLVEDVG